MQPTWRTAASATLHCLTGCAIGEVLGMIIGTAMHWHGAAVVAISVFLAFLLGYTLSLLPMLKAGLTLAAAIPIALAADTLSIVTMEIVDNAVMVLMPGAMGAGLANATFWFSMAIALAAAFVAAVPVNYFLIKRGLGHAIVHRFHDHQGHEGHGDHHDQS